MANADLQNFVTEAVDAVKFKLSEYYSVIEGNLH